MSLRSVGLDASLQMKFLAIDPAVAGGEVPRAGAGREAASAAAAPFAFDGMESPKAMAQLAVFTGYSNQIEGDKPRDLVNITDLLFGVADRGLANSPQFRGLSPEVQAKAADLLAKVAGDKTDSQTIERMLRSSAFRGLSEKEQKNMLDGLGNTKEARTGLRTMMDSSYYNAGLDDSFGGNSIQLMVLRQVARAIAPVETGLGKEVDAIVNKSLTLTRHFRDIINQGWNVSFGTAGDGSFANPRTKSIVLDPNLKSDPAAVAQVLGHEVGHAKNPGPPAIPPSGLTRQEYIDKNVALRVRGEAEAAFENMVARQEILDNGGEDIGINGSQSEAYRRIFESYRAGTITRDEALDQITRIWGPNERTSTTHQTYNDYYDDDFINFWDANYSHIPAGGRAP